MGDLDRTGIIVFSSKILSNILGFASVIFFARRLGAVALGIYFAFHTLVSVLSVFSEFGVPGAVVKRISQTEHEEGREAYLGGAVLLATSIFIAITVLLLIFQAQITEFVGLASTIPLLIAILVTSNSDRLMRSVLRGEHRVGTAAWVRLFGQIVRLSLSVTLVLLGFGVIALLYGLLARKVSQTIIAFLLTNTGFAVPSYEHISSLFGFSKYTAGMNVSNLMYNWTDTLVLTILATKRVVGIYEVTWQITMVTLLGAQAIGIALAPTVTRWHEDGSSEKIETAFTNSITFALLLVVPALFGVAVLGEEILRILYQYKTGSTVLVILMTGQVSQAIKNVSQNVLFGINQPDKVFWTNLLTVGANVLLNLMLVPNYGMVGAAIATLLTACVAAGSQVAYLKRYMSVSFRWTNIGWQVGLAGVMAIILHFLATFVSLQTIPLLGVFIGFSVLFYGIGTLVNTELRNRLLNSNIW